MPKCRKGKVVENKVCRNYKKAGFKVKLRKKTSVGEIDVLARRKNQKVAVEVKHGNKKRYITSKDVEKIAKKANAVKAKPVLVLSGRAKITSTGRREAKNKNVRIRKINL